MFFYDETDGVWGRFDSSLIISSYILWSLKHIQLILKRAGIGKFHWISSPADYYTPLDRQYSRKVQKEGCSPASKLTDQLITNCSTLLQARYSIDIAVKDLPTVLSCGNIQINPPSKLQKLPRTMTWLESFVSLFFSPECYRRTWLFPS